MSRVNLEGDFLVFSFHPRLPLASMGRSFLFPPRPLRVNGSFVPHSPLWLKTRCVFAAIAAASRLQEGNFLTAI